MLFKNVFVGDRSLVSDSVIFGDVKIGKNVRLKNCIVDKHVTIPDGEVIGFDPVRDAERFTLSENGIAVIPESYSFE